MVLSVSYSSWCLGSAAVCDCGTPWTVLVPLFGAFCTFVRFALVWFCLFPLALGICEGLRLVYTTDRSKAAVPVLVLLFVALWFILRGDLFYVLLCYFILVFFSPFSIAITSLGEARANLGVFHTFVRFALVWFCLFPLPHSVWEGLRFVIVAFPGLF